MSRRFSTTHADLTELVPSVARLAVECIGNSDALYHNVEHTMLVTLVGYDIMKGRSLLTPTYPSDYAHMLVACLMHDIGYVRGILKGDGADGYVIDDKGNKTKLPRGASDAALLSHHVDRSKLFVMDRISKIELLDAERIARAIEYTRFPSPHGRDDEENEEGLLVRAADLIGQLGDPHYLRKANALYFEFEEVGMNVSSATLRRPISPTFIRSSTGTAFRRTSRPRSATSMSRQADGNGSPIFTATCSVPSANSAFAVRSADIRPGTAPHIKPAWVGPPLHYAASYAFPAYVECRCKEPHARTLE